jgi:phenylacetate-CoA ligase
MFFAADSEMLAVLCQMQMSERWPAERMREAQCLQLSALLEHAVRTIPFYAQRLQLQAANDIDRAVQSIDRWRELPILTREDVRAHGKQLRSDNFPQSHGSTYLKKTSGSTGQPVEVLRTSVTQRMWEATALRDHVWQQRDASLPCAVIRALTPDAPPPDGLKFDTWGYPYDRLWQSAPAFTLDLVTDVAVQADWLRRTKPAYLLTYPTNVAALLEQFAGGERPPIKEIICVGEPISAQLALDCREILGAKMSANYSSQEVGYMALLCPDCGQYHVQSETVFLELLNDDGQECQPGEVGRIVVTDLHNFAMPLIRYEIGDYGEAGGPCSAGRTLPSLRRVLGRRRNMVVHPDGRRHWPLTGFAHFNEVAPIRQYQFIQHTRHEIEVRLVADVELTSSHRAALSGIIIAALGHPFRLSFSQHGGRLDRGQGGKFEEFVCLAE